jgi:predicted house-cleaning noncanonical NTP pyrophosphatase (MazG superfamily)
MPTFKLNKIIRDKLVVEYERLGQKAKYKKLSPVEHKKELIRKIIEEASEIDVNDSLEKTAGEIADVQQALRDLASLCGVGNDQIEIIRQAKFDRKGGFAGGNYVTTLTFANDDEWVEYYRERPDVFLEE